MYTEKKYHWFKKIIYLSLFDLIIFFIQKNLLVKIFLDQKKYCIKYGQVNGVFLIQYYFFSNVLK